MDTPRLAELLWTNDQPDAETYTQQHNTITTYSHPHPKAGFEPVNPASEWLQTHALHRALGSKEVTLQMLNISESWTV